MPYITGDRRGWIDSGCLPETAGELNYAITVLVKSYLGASPNYQRFNDVMGALEGCKLELYRRQISKYEDQKAVQNGDVYET
jgi:hypothetical protein